MTMNQLTIQKHRNGMPTDDDITFALSAAGATLVGIEESSAAKTVRFAGRLDQQAFRKALSSVTRSNGYSWQISWHDTEAGPVGGSSAATGYSVDITMSEETVRKLTSGEFLLYGFKAVQSAQGGGEPLVWFKSSVFTVDTQVAWSEQYQAYTSRSQIIPGGVVRAHAAYDIDLGQTLEVDVQGLGRVTGQPDPSRPIGVHNNITTEFTCGISQQQGTEYAPLCAFPLYGRQLNQFVPIERVLLMFGTVPVNTGTVIERAFSPGLLIDLTTDVRRTVTFDINLGWGPGDAPWAKQVPADAKLAQLLIDKPSGALITRNAVPQREREAGVHHGPHDAGVRTFSHTPELAERR
jgi:hypothetical protein